MAKPIQNEKLQSTLYGFQIFFIVLTAVIGHGVFSTNGAALAVAGPWGLIFSIMSFSVVAIAVCECVGELIQQFPIYNGIVAFVQEFVDEDLGFVIGIAHWYCYAAAFATQNATAVTVAAYWGKPEIWQQVVFYIAGPLVMIGLNTAGVFWYGIVETISGILKLIFILFVSIYLYAIAGEIRPGAPGEPRLPISDGILAGGGFSNAAKAVCYAIPLVAFSFQGIEINAMAAFEARDAHSIRWPARWTVYIVAVAYLMCSIGEALTVKWTHPSLPTMLVNATNNPLTNHTARSFFPRNVTGSGMLEDPQSKSMIVIAALNAGHGKLAGFLNGFLLFSVLSAANTSLYASSRTLYGLVKDGFHPNWITTKLEGLGVVSKRNGVPTRALWMSGMAFLWIPFLQLVKGNKEGEIIHIMAMTSSTSCMIVWAAMCLAFLRYYYWLKKCDRALDDHPELKRGSTRYHPVMNFDLLQPIPAWIGLFGCLLCFGFLSATWWDQDVTVKKAVTAYAAHIVLFLVFILLKMSNKRLFNHWGVRLSKDGSRLIEVLKRLQLQKIDRMSPQLGKDLLHWVYVLMGKNADASDSTTDAISQHVH